MKAESHSTSSGRDWTSVHPSIQIIRAFFIDNILEDENQNILLIFVSDHLKYDSRDLHRHVGLGCVCSEPIPCEDFCF